MSTTLQLSFEVRKCRLNGPTWPPACFLHPSLRLTCYSNVLCMHTFFILHAFGYTWFPCQAYGTRLFLFSVISLPWCWCIGHWTIHLLQILLHLIGYIWGSKSCCNWALKSDYVILILDMITCQLHCVTWLLKLQLQRITYGYTV